MSDPVLRVHATCVAVDGAGLLLRGPPGSGKSDLALRLIDAGAMLVADDQTELRRRGAEIIASAPATIAGRLEIRGVGIVTLPHVTGAKLRLVVDLVAADQVERLPDRHTYRYLDLELPLLKIAPFEASAPAKLHAALRSLAHRVSEE